MPTPFTHLAAAYELANLMPAEISTPLQAHWGAFLLGNIAPDVQTLSGQTREATHFFPVPLQDTPPAEAQLLTGHPALAHPEQLPPDQAAFVAGYLAHLAFDQLWIRHIFWPVFADETWGDWPERMYLHNILRAYVDAQDLSQLPSTVEGQLRAAAPYRWLPFVGDAHLRAWRDYVGEQLGPGAASRTIEVFAQRAGLEPQAFAALLQTPDELEARVFTRVPLTQLTTYHTAALQRSAALIQKYWQGALGLDAAIPPL